MSASVRYTGRLVIDGSGGKDSAPDVIYVAGKSLHGGDASL